MDFKREVRQFLLDQGYWTGRKTSDAELDAFFDMTRPVPTHKDLIRVGGRGDGGYLLPDDLENITACFSPGVSNSSTFEEDLAARGIKSYMVDYSVTAPAIENELFHFEKLFLGDLNDGIYLRFEDWVRNNSTPDETDLLLQMDIEGAEFTVILDTPTDILKRFRILVIEFHFMDRLFSGDAFPFLNQVFQKITREFCVVHIHPNNCCPVLKSGKCEVPTTMEFTFHRTENVVKATRDLEFPHALDVPCVAGKPDIILPECWQSKSRRTGDPTA